VEQQPGKRKNCFCDTVPYILFIREEKSDASNGDCKRIERRFYRTRDKITQLSSGKDRRIRRYEKQLRSYMQSRNACWNNLKESAQLGTGEEPRLMIGSDPACVGGTVRGGIPKEWLVGSGGEVKKPLPQMPPKSCLRREG